MFNYGRETVYEKLEYEMFSEQCTEQAKEEKLKCDGLDCAWCGIVVCPRQVLNDG